MSAAILPVCTESQGQAPPPQERAHASFALPFLKFINTAQENLYYFTVNQFIQIPFVKPNKAWDSV